MPGGSFDIEAKTAELEELRTQVSKPDLWDDPDAARALTTKLSRYEAIIADVDSNASRIEDASMLLDIADEEGDASVIADVIAEIEDLDQIMSTLERETLFFGEYDERAAIVSVHAGAGGVDAQDWAEMMLRMYTRYLERSDLSYEIDEILDGDEAGIKSATLTVRGPHAYGIMEGERGVHRLVRISPFDANSRRHTSFAGVDVIPEVAAEEVEINSDDLKIDTFRASGAGGQHINKTDSAVRITHLPTGIVVACQAERSQLQNRTRAMALLAARLAERARQEQQEEIDEIRGEQNEAGWGRQIRSYVLQPYQMIKDLRTSVEVGNVQAILDGDIDPFIDGYLHWRRQRQVG